MIIQHIDNGASINWGMPKSFRILESEKKVEKWQFSNKFV